MTRGNPYIVVRTSGGNREIIDSFYATVDEITDFRRYEFTDLDGEYHLLCLDDAVDYIDRKTCEAGHCTNRAEYMVNGYVVCALDLADFIGEGKENVVGVL